MLKGIRKMKKVLYVKIGYQNGVYILENDSVCSEIPEDIYVNTPFYNQENSIDDLVDTILEEPEKDVVFLYNDLNQVLVRKLGKKLSSEFSKNVIFVCDELNCEYIYLKDNVKIYLIRQFEDLKRIKDINFRVSEVLPEIKTDPSKKYNSRYYLTMKNGYDAFITGIYPEQISSTLAKHIGVEASSDIDSATDNIDMNGAIIIKEGLKEEDKFDRIVHLHHSHENSVSFDESKYSYRRKICTYSQYLNLKKKNELEDNIIYFLKIESSEDLAGFRNELVYFRQTGKIDTVERRLVDECRWTNQCSLKRMIRYSICGEYIKPCLSSDKTLIGINADHDEKLIAANRIADHTLIRRNCVECQSRNICSKCACLPELIDSSLYCSVFRDFPYVSEYLKKKQLVNFLSKSSNILKDMEEIEVSSSVHCFEYPMNKNNNPTIKSVYIFKKDNNYFYLHLLKGNLIKVERKFVFLLEAWVLGESQERIISNMVDKYNLNLSDAERLVVNGYEMLKKEGMIS